MQVEIPISIGFIAEPFGIISPVHQQRGRVRDLREQRPRPDVIRGTACQQKHLDRASLGIGQNMQLRVQPALGAPDQPSVSPFGASGSTPSCAFSDVSPAPAGQFGHDGGEHTHSAPALPAVVKRLCGTIGGRRMLPHQTVALTSERTVADAPSAHRSTRKACP